MQTSSYRDLRTQFSVDDFEKMKTTAWEGVRNHEAKNLMKEMQIGDQVRRVRCLTRAG